MGAAVHFTDVDVDIAARRIRRAGEEQHLEPQAFDLMVVLIQHAHRVVPKEELLERVWGHQFVSESALTTRIKEIRRATGDDGRRQSVIRNARGRGYQFVAEIVTPKEQIRPPRRAAQLIGRETGVEHAHRLLDGARLVTVIGPGGVGKTALARHVARERAAAHRDGVIEVALAPIAEQAAVPAAVRRAAQLSDDAERGGLPALAALDALVVLDNCEHVIDGVADLVTRLFAEPGNVAILATSRERLGVADEQLLPLEVLSLAAAVELFAERAGQAQPGFVVDTATLASVQALVNGVDRLPLAIEMAAARVGAIAVGDLVELLSDELDVLRSGDRSADPRHRTLGALVAWSERLLGDLDRRILAELSAFAGGVDRDDVAGVVGEDVGRAARSLADLAERSLLVADTSTVPTRYRMLATVRAQVSKARPYDAAERHARWFLGVASDADDRLRTPDEGAARERIELAVDELRLAHTWLRGHDPVAAAKLSGALDLFAHGRHWSEPARWAAEVLPQLAADHPTTAAVHAALASDAAHRGDFDEVESHGRAALECGGVRARTSALEALGDAAMYRGQFELARSWCVELEATGRMAADPNATAMGALGRVLADVYAERRDALHDALTLDAGVPGLSPSSRGWIAYVRGEALAREHPSRAMLEFDQAVQLAREVGHRFLAGVTTVAMLAVRALRGDATTELGAFAPVLTEYRRAGDVSHLITGLRHLVALLVRLGDDQPATEILASLDGALVARPGFGPEPGHLATARAVLADRVPRRTHERWVANGMRRSLAETVDVAVAAIGART